MEEIVKITVTPELKRSLHPGNNQDIGQEIEVVMRSINYGEWKEIRKLSIIIKEVNGVSTQFRDIDTYDLLSIVAHLKSCPFDKTIENIKKLSRKDGQRLEEVAYKLDYPDEMKEILSP